jgi:sugar-specific transcriptional regulator TrmB
MQITELAAKLEPLGLNDKESRVYVASLFLGPSSVQKIAQQADINRATAYVILDQLADLGLVSQSTEGKKTVFVAEPPEALENLFNRQQEVIEERKNTLKALLPDLKAGQRVGGTDSAPVVRFYRGLEGITNSTNELRRKARPKSEVYGFANYDEVVKIVPDIFKQNPVARLKKQISSKVIYSFKGGDMSSDPKLLRETKKVSSPVKADILLYEDTAGMMTYREKPNEITGIIIESPEIVAALRQLFELAWKNNK